MGRPNIVLVMTDQQRADVSAREGFELDSTPFLDSLARSGCWFDRAYTSAPNLRAGAGEHADRPLAERPRGA